MSFDASLSLDFGSIMFSIVYKEVYPQCACVCPGVCVWGGGGGVCPNPLHERPCPMAMCLNYES